MPLLHMRSCGIRAQLNIQSPSTRILLAHAQIWDILNSGWSLCGDVNLSQRLMRKEQLCDPSFEVELSCILLSQTDSCVSAVPKETSDLSQHVLKQVKTYIKNI